MEEIKNNNNKFSKKSGKHGNRKSNKHFHDKESEKSISNFKSKEKEIKIYKTEQFPPERYCQEDEENKFNNFSQDEFLEESLSPQKPGRKYTTDGKDSDNYSTSNEDNSNEQFQNYGINNYKPKASDFQIKYKTELCKYFEINGFCKFGDKCAYAHGKDNLRSKVTKTTAYRSRKCIQFFEKGFCPYGNRCQFAHAIKSNISNNPYEKNMSYSKRLEILSKIENVENIKSFPEKARLPIFEEIVPSNTKAKGTKENCFLFEEIKNFDKSQLFERF